MSLSQKLDHFHLKIRSNRWMVRFTTFTRILLAAGFIPSGLQKVIGERFTVLPVNHPMGHYLDALYQTGYYYTTIGVMQVLAALLLLIPRTATIGVVIYFPIILNICILSLAVRFDGSLITSPLMVLACLYLIFWDYNKFKYLLPFQSDLTPPILPEKHERTNKFPTKWFAVIFFTGVLVIVSTQLYAIKPRNTLEECNHDCIQSDNPETCLEFCECVHLEGKSLENCLKKFD